MTGVVQGFFVNLNRTFQTVQNNKPMVETIEPLDNRDDLFRYTSGRWLTNETHHLEQPFVKFDVNSLCALATGISTKAFLLTMNDGNEVIAKIPCPNSGTPLLTTASEVATLQFFPEVYVWCSDPTNPVGAEYILMEKILGERYKLIDRILQMEKELESCRFPAYGSLFLRDSLLSGYRHYSLFSDLDPTGMFCIGPSCNRAYSTSAEIPSSDIGPWTSTLEFALCAARRELALLKRYSDDQSVDEYSELLQKALLILPALTHNPHVVKAAGSIIWHTDLHLGNIYVSAEHRALIEGVIDWQSAQASPLFIQAHFPEFLRPPKDYSPGTEIPALPDNYEELDATQKEAARKAQTLAVQSKYYEMSCLVYNKPVYNAMRLDRRLWEPFTCCQLPSSGSMVPLRNSLIRLSQDWVLLGLPGSCPVAFNEEELRRHTEQVRLYHDSRYSRDIVKDQLGTDDSGWVPLEQWESTNKLNKYLFDMYVEAMSEETPAEGAAQRWPFPPG
ncbi:uncharacterized protein BO97DRAFT_447899 [Aspergillus homomorphus CBS 101889]|uniref:Altered inheritance of mitochondria protein 9, mitochondrial n=1 Tax=Aspergillus homomorphus (strain CBS 101889) TaxID=1450537 RepID=A0A395IB67_ASPHC|nr:hypothetical protein BO97DRAFT_447899 [Aspergillus homomorphus CBS 101889]RAL17480.1 hypothetical protein BO97DRAFT_447899 [Aspergillus homomorphus CBS 101889]